MSHRIVALTLLAALAFVAGGPPGRARAQDKPAPAEDAVPQLLETVGLLAGLQLYQTYLNIGFLADGRADGSYEDAEVRQLLASILTPLEAVEKRLAAVVKLAPAKEDREAVDRLRTIAGLLRRQGKELEAFWASGKEADGDRYESTRKEAWKQISAVLGLDKE